MQPYLNPMYFQQTQFQPQMPTYQPTTLSQQIQNPTTGIFGKWVDSFEAVSANDVPMQGVSVFPKNDLTEIVCKKWNANGTIETTRYLPQIDVEKDSTIKSSPSDFKGQFEEIRGHIEDVRECLSTLTDKIDKISRPTTRKKEVADES